MQASKAFPFLPFLSVLLLVLAVVGGLNYLIDPLWYAHGNQLTGRNYAFNERIAKVNLLSRTQHSGYDCLIFGSSRVTALPASRFAGQTCFNFALRGAEVGEFEAYARHARALGLQPKTIYVGVDDFNFLHDPKTERRSNPQVKGTPDVLHAFLSADVLVFSLMTLAGLSPDPRSYYDSNFEELSTPSEPWPGTLGDQPDLRCDDAAVARYIALRKVFPEARAIAFAPLMAPRQQMNGVYLRGVLDCELAGFHAVAQGYDAFLDFGIPSVISTDPAMTFDGAHFYSGANAAVIDQLQGRRNDLALDVKAMSLAAYQAEVKTRLRNYLERENLMEWWRG
ncbi:MAG: hypothetical protein V4709_05975 [Pseudomonadota bacterium]